MSAPFEQEVFGSNFPQGLLLYSFWRFIYITLNGTLLENAHPPPLPQCYDVPVRPPTGTKLKTAVTVMLVFMVRVQAPVPEHAPYQPTNVDPGLGVAVTVTTLPDAKLKQLAPHF